MFETIERLTEIIRMEADIIDRAFCLLLQHVSTEDDAMQELIDDIADVCDEKAGIDEWLPWERQGKR